MNEAAEKPPTEVSPTEVPPAEGSAEPGLDLAKVPATAGSADQATVGSADQATAGPTPARAPAHRGAESPVYNDWPHRYLKRPVRRVLNRAVMRVTVEGWENIPADGPLLFAGNHSSFMDGPLVVIESPRTVRCLVKSELYGGFLGRLLHLVGQIPVDRGRPDRVALHTALDELARGGAIGVFPEGTRGTGEMQAVQHGIAYLAVHGRCPILPVACIGTAAALPKGAKWPNRSPARVVFGRPFSVEIPANPRSRKALAAVAEDIRVRLADHLSQAAAG